MVDQEFKNAGGFGSSLQSQSARFAQPFIPTQDGALVDVSITVDATIPYEFASAQLHEYPVSGAVAPAPVAGGIGVLSFDAATGPTTLATASFPDRPSLEQGKRYAVVIDPQVHTAQATTSASFPMQFSSDSDYFLTQDGINGWGSNAYTGHIFFTVRLALPIPDVVVTPVVPTFVASSACDVPGTVTLPTENGVEYTRVDSGTNVTVTATALDGFAFTAGSESSWTFSTAALPCAQDPVEVTPESPEFIPGACDVAGILTPPETTGISYVVTGPASNTVVTATALNGYVLVPGTQATWSYDLRALSCEKPVVEKPNTEIPVVRTPGQAGPELAKTGAELAAWPSVSLVLIVMGAGILLVRTRPKRG